MATPGRNKFAVVALCLAALAVGLGLLRHLWLARSAESLLGQAVRSTSPSTTYADARHWLERNGFHVVTTAGGVTIGGEEHQFTNERYHIVQGFKRIAPDDPLGGRWMDLTFRFTTEDRFHDVQMDTGSPPPRWSRHGTTVPRD